MIADPAAVFEGCTENANLFGAPAVTLKALLVALVSEPSVANRVKPIPALLGTRLEKVATPRTRERRGHGEIEPKAGEAPRAYSLVDLGYY